MVACCKWGDSLGSSATKDPHENPHEDPCEDLRVDALKSVAEEVGEGAELEDVLSPACFHPKAMATLQRHKNTKSAKRNKHTKYNVISFRHYEASTVIFKLIYYSIMAHIFYSSHLSHMRHKMNVG